MKADLIERYAANLHGVLSCFDRILITGTLPGACYAAGMTSFLNAHGIRIFDYAGFAEPLRERIRVRAQEVCAAASIEIEHVNKSHIRKEDLVARVLQATWRCTRAGARHLGDGGLPELQAVARQERRQTQPAPRDGQVSALLLLLHR